MSGYFLFDTVQRIVRRQECTPRETAQVNIPDNMINSENNDKHKKGKRNVRRYPNPRSSMLFKSVELTEIMAFADVLGDEKVRTLFEFDLCCKMADRFLVAMVFVYFKRAEFLISEYNPANFFLALYLAHDMEEDEDSWKADILPLALGVRWRFNKLNFLVCRDRFWKRLNYRAVVSRRSCEAVFSTVIPESAIWRRQRPACHSYALRPHHRSDSELEPAADIPFIRFCPTCFCKPK